MPITCLEAVVWRSGEGYQRFVGRWSTALAGRFLAGVRAPDGGDWLDVGCGTGALVAEVARTRAPRRAVGLDPSPELLAVAERRASEITSRVSFEIGVAEALPHPDASFDAVVSGLALNFTTDPRGALAEMARVTRPGGRIGLYVWDYDHPDLFVHRYWAAAEHVLGHRAAGDERRRWPVCSADGLAAVASAAGIEDASVSSVTTPTRFADLDELWDGFALGVGPVGASLASLPAGRKRSLRAALEQELPVAGDGSVLLTARAWTLTATRTAGGDHRHPPTR